MPRAKSSKNPATARIGAIRERLRNVSGIASTKPTRNAPIEMIRVYGMAIKMARNASINNPT
jgi:hypothetical protein